MIHHITPADVGKEIPISVPQMAVGKIGLGGDGTNVVELVEHIAGWDGRTQELRTPDVYDIGPGQYRVRIAECTTPFELALNIP